MSTNGKGSKRRPETNPGTYVRNWDEINWSKPKSQDKPEKKVEVPLNKT